MRLISILVLASGCFYMEPVNQRPSIDIVPTSSDPLHRGDTVTLNASIDDPEGQAVALTWRAYACSEATAPGGCDDVTFKDSLPADSAQDFTFMVPIHRADMTTPVQSLRIELDAVDSLGATARPSQQLVMPVTDGPPTLTLRSQSRYGYVINTPLQVYALVGDPDDGKDMVRPLDWQVFSPIAPPPALDDISAPPSPDPSMNQFGKQLVPDQLGAWTVQVTATDPLGVQTPKMQPLTIVPDHAPCLAQASPIAPPPGSTLPITDPTLFQVLIVGDDLDPYPTILNDAIYGAETFTWSLLPPGATTRQVLTGATGASVPIDPASYTPGDIVELRVEIADRNHTPVNCTDSDPTCSVISDPSCIQRLTWRVEVR